jgi:hypothetical protein
MRFGALATLPCGPVLIALILQAATATSCKSARQEARTFGRCSRQIPCRPPNICLRKGPSGSGSGLCVHPCQRHGQCPDGFRCTGRYRMEQSQGRFCRPARVGLGGDCSGPRAGCRSGLRCFKKRCRLACSSDAHCPDPRNRCLEILASATLREELAAATLPEKLAAATLPEELATAPGPDVQPAGHRPRKHAAASIPRKRTAGPSPREGSNEKIPQGSIGTPHPVTGPRAHPSDSRKSRPWRVCLRATRTQGETCAPGGPFCARAHVCHAGRCLRECRSDTDCGDGQVCDGALYTGARARQRAAAELPPDRLYCRKAGDPGEPCDLSRDKSCARGLYCLGARCRRIRHVRVGRPCRELRGILCSKGGVCYAGRCRKPCKKNADCPWRKGRRLECRLRPVEGKARRICL